MCGIVGFVTNKSRFNDGKNNLEMIINGLKALQYRGYDSAGIAFLQQNKTTILKDIGKESIIHLEKDITAFKSVNIAIGHTRWATHGPANLENCHPHQIGNITIVHNGIIENYLSLKTDLIKSGYTFSSQTDSEVAAALIHQLYIQEKDMTLALLAFQKQVQGAYAIAILNQDQPETLYALRHESPLVVGISNNSYFIASDTFAFPEDIDSYIILNHGDIVEINSKNYMIYDHYGNPQVYQTKTLEKTSIIHSKHGEQTFTLKEIKEQPTVIENTFNRYFNEHKALNYDLILKHSRYQIVACGSAYHAGLVGKTLIEHYAHRIVHIDLASEYRYKPILDNQSLLIAISQSGETADTLKAIEHAKQQGISTLSMVNNEHSNMQRICDEIILTLAGKEVGVATTKAYLAQIAEFALICHQLQLQQHQLNKQQMIAFKQACTELPGFIQNIIDQQTIINKIAKQISNHQHLFFLGRGIDYALAQEASLKLKELSYIHSEAYAAGELKHGTISLIEEKTPVIAIITDEALADKTLSNCEEVIARGADVYVFTHFNINVTNSKIKVFKFPKTHDLLQPILAIIPMQILAYEIASIRGCDVDMPRNLAKSVTVE